jgi:hypothetical protein
MQPLPIGSHFQKNRAITIKYNKMELEKDLEGTIEWKDAFHLTISDKLPIIIRHKQFGYEARLSYIPTRKYGYWHPSWSDPNVVCSVSSGRNQVQRLKDILNAAFFLNNGQYSYGYIK